MLRTTLGFMRAPALALAVLLAPVAAPVAGPWAQEAQAQQAADGAATPFRPVAVVNGSAITGFDLAQRAEIMVALGFPAEDRNALRNAALERLIEDRLKLQEAERLGISPTPEQIEAGVVELARNAGAEPNELLALLSAQGVSQQALEDLVAAEAVWRDVVRTRFSRRFEPGESEIDSEIEQLRDRAGRALRIAEIGLPMEEDGRTAAETRALAEELSERLSRGGDFTEAVRRHSRAPSAAEGGEVGWVTPASLPPRIAEALAGLEPGDVSRPIEVSGGLSVLKVLETRAAPAAEIDAADPELRERVRSQLAGQQGARLAESLLQELRRDALIETR